MTTLEIQKALKDKGFDPGPLDGIRGARTISAVMAFQRVNNLEVDGVVGPMTSAALFGAAAPPTPDHGTFSQQQPWMIEAQSLLGLKEDTSDGSNPLIIGWAKALKLNYADDETPWCGLFVAHCIGSQLPTEPRPGNPLGARNWSQFGVKTDPQLGAVMVFWRKSLNSGLGHVAFYVGEDASAYHVLGGNQSDRVSVTRMPKDRFVGARWPCTVPDSHGPRRMMDASGKLSSNEQ